MRSQPAGMVLRVRRLSYGDTASERLNVCFVYVESSHCFPISPGAKLEWFPDNPKLDIRDYDLRHSDTAFSDPDKSTSCPVVILPRSKRS